MSPETKNCQNCKNDFTILPDDFSFYEKIKVPPPTFCPECRMIRRMCWRNARSLHKRDCGLCNKTIISMYKEDGVPVYCNECYNGDNWDPYLYATSYDFNTNFFDQLRVLFTKAPRYYKYAFGNLINSEYTNFSKDNKSTYLSYSVVGCEDVAYCETIDNSKNSLDSYAVMNIGNCSYNIDCEGNYNTHFAVQSLNCLDSYFIYDCSNCSNCCLSTNLRNQQYYFKNKKLSKEAYQEAVRELKLDEYSGLENARENFDEILEKEAIHKYGAIYAAEKVNGDYIHHAKNIKYGFDVNDAENISYGNRVIEVKDSMDLTGIGFKAELIYESMAATANTFKDFFCYITIQGCRECEYSLNLKNCSNCFGCVSLTNTQYCILNKQYEKEEYFEMVEKIKKHMNDMPYVDAKGRVFKYGEFLPYDMSPFGYNETNAHDFFTISKEKALEKGYNWFNREKREYATTKNIDELPNSILETTDDILNETIACPNNGNADFQCTSAFRISQSELQFLRQKKLPLPRYCPNCRHYQRLKYRNPLKLYTRTCTNGCGNSFETTYAPNRPEKVYCEKCYQQEVL